MKHLLVRRASVLALALFSVLGCSKGGGSSDSTPALTPTQLVAQDINAFTGVDTQNLHSYDSAKRGLFSAIFGGVTADAINAYLSARIHYYVSPDDLKSFTMQPPSFHYTGWTNTSADDNSNVELGGANIGTELWLNGLLDSVPVTVFHGSQSFPVTDSRFGLMLIGPGYRSTEQTQDGRTFNIPAAYRQSILLHEARHSDCTGGITQNDLQLLRGFTSYAEMDANFAGKACGHIHSLCPSGTYQGLPACDDHAWGAYGVQLVFLSAVLPTFSGIDQAIMESAVADTASRTLFPADQMLNGSMGPPDMINQGLK